MNVNRAVALVRQEGSIWLPMAKSVYLSFTARIRVALYQLI